MKMTALTQGTYEKFIKSMVSNFEEFLNDIDRNDVVFTDESTIGSFRTMGRTLQRIFSKWDKNRTQPKASTGMESKPLTENGGLFHESFLYGGPENGKMVRVEPMDTASDNSVTSATRKDDTTDRIRKRMKKDIEESDDEFDATKLSLHSPEKPAEPVGIKDPDIEKVGNDQYRCKICDRTMMMNNVQSHLKGKSHKNKSRDNSCGRQSSITSVEDDIARILDPIRLELRQNAAGEQYIIRSTSNAFYRCNVCKVEISRVEKNLLEHVQGQSHRRIVNALS